MGPIFKRCWSYWNKAHQFVHYDKDHRFQQNVSVLMHNSPISLSVIKCTVINNNAANTNDKTAVYPLCLTATHQKLQKL